MDGLDHRQRRFHWLGSLSLAVLCLALDVHGEETVPQQAPGSIRATQAEGEGNDTDAPSDAAAADADSPAGSDDDSGLLDLPLEQLTSMPVRVPVPPVFETEITSVARTPVRVAQTPAAVYVITQEDIRRSGVRTLPDALRMAPGVEVAQVDTSTFAISIRGFNDVFSNKLLVLVDGRSIYTPTFSGVYWDMRDVLLEDIERIEVIRGPGSTIWGVNAVNGIINIITFSAKDTQGAYVGGGGGLHERSFGEGRIGGKLGENTYYRVFAKYFDRDNSVFLDDPNQQNDWQNYRGGFRIDSDISDEDQFTVQGGIFKGQSGPLQDVSSLTPPYFMQSTDPTNYAGGHVLSRFAHRFSDDADWAIQLWYDRTDLTAQTIAEIRDTVDLDFVNRYPIGRRHEMTWGAGYRFTTDQERGSFSLSFDPPDRSLHFVSTFLQDEFKLIEDKLSWFLGSKFEYNTFTGFVAQPGTRLLWNINERQTWWSSVTRAVRLPSRAEDDIRIVSAVVPAGQIPDPTLPPDLPVAFTINGNRRFYSEEVLALESGYRIAPTETLGFDFATFLNFYDDLRTTEPLAPIFVPSPIPAVFVGQQLANLMYGQTYGAEIAATWDAAEFWKLRGSYTLLQMDLGVRSGSSDTSADDIEGQSPNNQFSVRSFLNLSRQIDLDTSVYYVDSLPAFDIPSYFRVDLRLAWHPTRSLDFVFGVQNLFDNLHREFDPTVLSTANSAIERAIYGMVQWRF